MYHMLQPQYLQDFAHALHIPICALIRNAPPPSPDDQNLCLNAQIQYQPPHEASSVSLVGSHLFSLGTT